MTFEDLFKLAAANDAEITLSFKPVEGEERRIMGDCKKARINVALPSGVRIGKEFVVDARSARDQRDRGSLEAAHLRETIREVGFAVKDYLVSPGEMLRKFAGFGP